MYGQAFRKNMESFLPGIRVLSSSSQTYSHRFKQIEANQLKELIKSGAYLHGTNAFEQICDTGFKGGCLTRDYARARNFSGENGKILIIHPLKYGYPNSYNHFLTLEVKPKITSESVSSKSAENHNKLESELDAIIEGFIDPNDGECKKIIEDYYLNTTDLHEEPTLKEALAIPATVMGTCCFVLANQETSQNKK
jgi:hypothetical protein